MTRPRGSRPGSPKVCNCSSFEVRTLVSSNSSRLAAASQVLGAVSYRSVLARGFALVRAASGVPLPRAANVAAHQALRIEFADGEVAATASGPVGEAPPRRARPRPQNGEQGSLF